MAPPRTAHRQISAQAAAAQATGLAPVRPPRLLADHRWPDLARARPPAAAHRAPRVGLTTPTAAEAQSGPGGASLGQPTVVPARGGTWLQAARAQAARLAVRLAVPVHVPTCGLCSCFYSLPA